MKRRNADSGKMRRPVKRTKISEGMYGNTMLYLKFVLIWATVVMADKVLEFRFEFLWPFWMMLRSVYDSYKYHGLAFSVVFLFIALMSDLICFFFIPLQYIFFAASTYVWVQFVWYSFADKGICLPTVVVCCLVVYAEGTVRGHVGVPLELWRPLAAHCIGYPALSLGFGVKSYVGQRLRLRRQRQVRAANEFYFQLVRDALPESALEHNQMSKEERTATTSNGVGGGGGGGSNTSCGEFTEQRHMNGSVRRRCARDQNGVCSPEHAQLNVKLEKLEKHLAQQTAARERDKPAHSQHTHTATASTHAPHANGNVQSGSSQSNVSTSTSTSTSVSAGACTSTHPYSNGTAAGAGAPDDFEHTNSKGAGRLSKCDKKEASNVREEKKRHKNRDKDKEKENNDSHNKLTENNKEMLIKEVESTKEIKLNNYKEREREKREEREREMREKERERESRERERETREREREIRDKEREREKEQRMRESRECGEELKKMRAELAAARTGEAEARRALAAAAAAERQRRTDLAHLRHAHAQLQNKVTTIRSGERAALERRLSEERRARAAAEQLLRARPLDGECDNEWCKSRRSAQESEVVTLRRELQRVRERAAQLQRDLAATSEQVRAGCIDGGACAALRERATYLERSLSAETRLKLDLLSALGDANRQRQIQESVLSKRDKELEELKAQMLAVMPTEFVTPSSGGVSKLRLSDGSPLDPNASIYTPKQLCSDA